MFRDKKLTIAIIIVLMISVIGLGIAFAAFSQTLTINGIGTVESSSWSVVFEGADGSNTIGAPTLTGTATEVTHPTIKNNSTEISNYAVTLKSPGDEVIYNFKIHNKGDYAANLTSLTIAGLDGITRNDGYVGGYYLVKDRSSFNGNTRPLTPFRYSFYYTSDDIPVGHYAARDCLEPGESVNVSLKLIFSLPDSTDTRYLSSTDFTFDNLEISAVYTQSNNGSCPLDPGTSVVDSTFGNIDYAYYTYEGKSFVGTGVDNTIISENITSKAKYSTAYASECSDGSAITTYYCPEGTTFVFDDHPAADAATAYCTGCRLITHAEANSWCGPDRNRNPKCVAKYNGVDTAWWTDEAYISQSAWCFSEMGDLLGSSYRVNKDYGVRPAVSIPSTATMTGSGTQLDPYVITTN